MREYKFGPNGELPVVRATIKGSIQPKQVALVLDTGCAVTQIHHEILSLIGCGPESCSDSVTIAGASGEGDKGYLVTLSNLKVLGANFTSPVIAGVDFSKWAHSGIEGLLGWDFVRRFHLDMDGPSGILKVLNSAS